VARRQPGNPEGWLLLGLAASIIVVVDSGLYAVLDYRMHHGRLPLGETAVFIRGGIGPPLLFVFALVILLFPDGRLPRRWTWVLWLYLAVAVVATVGPRRRRGRQHRWAAHPGGRERELHGSR